jgi:hypothetical protein
MIKQHELENRWQPLTVEKINNKLEDAKTTYAPLIADTLINLPDENRRFPPKIKELFDIMEQTLNLLPRQEVVNE